MDSVSDMWEMGVGGMSVMSIEALCRLDVAESGLACWYILLGLTGRRAGRAVDATPLTAGRRTLAIEAILADFRRI